MMNYVHVHILCGSYGNYVNGSIYYAPYRYSSKLFTITVQITHQPRCAS